MNKGSIRGKKSVFKHTLIRETLLPLTAMLDILVRDYLVGLTDYDINKRKDKTYEYSNEGLELQSSIADKIFTRIDLLTKHKKYGRLCRVKEGTEQYLFPIYNKGFISYRKLRDTRYMVLYLVNGYAIYCVQNVNGYIVFEQTKYKRVINVDRLESNLETELTHLKQKKKRYEDKVKEIKGKDEQLKELVKDEWELNREDINNDYYNTESIYDGLMEGIRETKSRITDEPFIISKNGSDEDVDIDVDKTTEKDGDTKISWLDMYNDIGEIDESELDDDEIDVEDITVYSTPSYIFEDDDDTVDLDDLEQILKGGIGIDMYDK